MISLSGQGKISMSMLVSTSTLLDNPSLKIYSNAFYDIPLWRYAGDDSLPIPITPADLIVCSALGQLDSRLGFSPHSIERFGDDRDGKRLHQAYLRGYRGESK